MLNFFTEPLETEKNRYSLFGVINILLMPNMLCGSEYSLYNNSDFAHHCFNLLSRPAVKMKFPSLVT